MNTNCQTCSMLWQEYSAATHIHIAVESKLEVATLRHDQPVIQQLQSNAQSAAAMRAQYRQQLREHRELAHSGERDGNTE